MTPERAAYILTMADEPALLLSSGQPVPTFTESEITQARAVSARMVAQILKARNGTIQ